MRRFRSLPVWLGPVLCWLIADPTCHGEPAGQAAAVAQIQRPAERLAVVPPVQPPVLSPQEQAMLDQLLAAWEARNATVRTWSCTFHKWEYNAWSPADTNGEQLAFA